MSLFQVRVDLHLYCAKHLLSSRTFHLEKSFINRNNILIFGENKQDNQSSHICIKLTSNDPSSLLSRQMLRFLLRLTNAYTTHDPSTPNVAETRMEGTLRKQPSIATHPLCTRVFNETVYQEKQWNKWKKTIRF